MSVASSSPFIDRDGQTARREQDVIERSLRGDVNAFDELVASHQDRIYNLCYWMLGQRDDAADAAQEAFVRAFRSLKNFRGDSAFGTWLHRIAVNACLDALQRRKKTPLAYSDLNTSEAGEGAEQEDIPGRHAVEEAEEQDPARLSLQRERREAVRQALAEIPEHYRLSLVLFDIEGHSYEEIATSLNLPLGTIKSRINRGRLALRERLQNKRELFEVEPGH